LKPDSNAPSRLRKWSRRLVFAIAAVIAILLVAYAERATLLTAAARCWIIDDSLKKADAIVVLGGGVAHRPAMAAQLYHEGWAPRVLYMQVKRSPVESLGLTPSESELTFQMLRTNGVPDSALERLGNSVGSTFDESRAVRAWLERTGAHSIIITTDLFHTRRARWIFRHELKGVPVTIEMAAVPLPEYSATNWWQDEDGVIAFEIEIFKSAYYHLRY
jgi:uncharacterized SAM-binding protein YcdF (DUF218 family)